MWTYFVSEYKWGRKETKKDTDMQEKKHKKDKPLKEGGVSVTAHKTKHKHAGQDTQNGICDNISAITESLTSRCGRKLSSSSTE